MDTLRGGFFSVGNNKNINLIRKLIIFTEYPRASMPFFCVFWSTGARRLNDYVEYVYCEPKSPVDLKVHKFCFTGLDAQPCSVIFSLDVYRRGARRALHTHTHYTQHIHIIMLN